MSIFSQEALKPLRLHAQSRSLTYGIYKYILRRQSVSNWLLLENVRIPAGSLLWTGDKNSAFVNRPRAPCRLYNAHYKSPEAQSTSFEGNNSTCLQHWSNFYCAYVHACTPTHLYARSHTWNSSLSSSDLPVQEWLFNFWIKKIKIKKKKHGGRKKAEVKKKKKSLGHSRQSASKGQDETKLSRSL